MSLRFGIKRLMLFNSMYGKSNNATQKRKNSAVCGPPKYPLKTWEAFVYGGGMAIGVLYMPVYTMFCLSEYAGTKDSKKE